MNRRELLHRTGALATVAGLAGCLGSSSGGSSPAGDKQTTQQTTAGDTTRSTTEETTTDDSKSESELNDETTQDDDSSFAGVESDDENPFRTVELGKRANARFAETKKVRGLLVWNAVDSARTIRLSVARQGETLFDERVEFDADAYLRLVLNEPADYRVSLGLSASETAGSSSAESSTFPVPRTSFDCNSATTHVGVMADGAVETQTVSTMMACPGPKVADTGFQAGNGQCGKQHSATVTYGSHDRVRLRGAVRTPNPRTPIGLAGTNYDQESDTLTVRVKAEQAESDSSVGAGTQCIGEVPYEAEVTFENGFPGTVVVHHETNDESVEVTSKSLGE